ncbi:MAG TPA: response regulator [Candidatus Omnitrophota bacterium]|nr:response regulator [Candidatus Omnitrophota bacterium]
MNIYCWEWKGEGQVCCKPSDGIGLSIPGLVLLVLFRERMFFVEIPREFPYTLTASESLTLKGSIVDAKRKILVIDDQEDLRLVVQDRLTRSGYEVETAEDGKAGLGKAKTLKPDLILLDVNMPKMDGFHVLEHLKKSGETRDIPVIMMTGRNQPEDIRKAIEGYAEKYITKPFEFDQLMAEVRSSLSLRKGNEEKDTASA